MKPRKKIQILAGTSAALALLYIITLFFDPQRAAARNASFVWLPGEGRDSADRIEITRPEGEKFTLARREGKWFAEQGPELFPVKQGRVEDLLRILGVRGAFPRRGGAASSHAGLGLSPDTAFRLVIKAGPSVEPLLDLMVGSPDTAYREVYLRKNGQNEYRSGDKYIRTYVSGDAESWYNLRFIEEGGADSIQRVQVRPYKDGEGDGDYTLVRSEGGWIFENNPGETPSKELVTRFLENFFILQADKFLPRTEAEGLEFRAARVSLEMGDGSTVILQGAEETGGLYPLMISGSPNIYLASAYVRGKFFEKKENLMTP